MEALEGRLTALETGLRDTNGILVHHQAGIVESHARHTQLIEELNTEFRFQRNRMARKMRLRRTVGFRRNLCTLCRDSLCS